MYDKTEAYRKEGVKGCEVLTENKLIDFMVELFLMGLLVLFVASVIWLIVVQ
ncbi:hypothetical protein [Bacillus cereus]|uniref:hypothetical protein n=1 Tax=Bacillus cereus TaxID=1396 RepID=UPI0015D52384|nr:hypothetical protein [Bacillus cereus]